MERDLDLIRDLSLLEEIEELENELGPQHRIARVNFVDAQNPLEYYNEVSFYNNMGFSKDHFLIVLDRFKDKFSTSLPDFSPFIQFTVFLHYLKSNSFLRNVSTQTVVQLPISAVHKIVNSVAKDIAFYFHVYIVYPSAEEQNIVAARVLEKYNVPGCPKVMDGTQIKIWLN